MSLSKRRIGRRAMGVVVGASLLVLGLEAPAFAAAPVISGLAPDSGPNGCVVVVTGTALDDFATAQWQFVSPTGTEVPADPATLDYVLISDTEAWVAVAGLTAGTSYNLKVTNAGGSSTSTGTFLATSGAGNCVPTITSITPSCGSTNDRVVIAGTNLLVDPDPLVVGNDIVGATVKFRPYATTAQVVPPDSDTATQLTRFVSADAQDGPIQVAAGGGTVFTTQEFLVPPPDCPLGGPQHARSITLSLRKHLVARGAVTVADDTTECIAGVPVKIQRRRAGAWKNVGTTTTSDTGTYKRRIKDKPGKYRAVAPAVTLEDASVCTKAVSPRVRHRH